jgi:hypothetical protein
MGIHHATRDFNFADIHLAPPIPIQGGSLYTKILHSSTDEPLFIYTPRCTSKGGVVASGSKKYIDLVFSQANNNILEWMSALEEHLCKLMFDHRAEWFTEELEFDDIQAVFIPMVKASKSNYVCRGYLQQGRQKIQTTSVQIYNEHETPRDLSDIKESTELITILEIQGVKFSAKSFQVMLTIKQIMIFEQSSTFTECLIRPYTTPIAVQPSLPPEPPAPEPPAPEPPAPEPEHEPPAPEHEPPAPEHEPVEVPPDGVIEVDIDPLPVEGTINIRTPSDIYRTMMDNAEKAKKESEESMKLANESNL